MQTKKRNLFRIATVLLLVVALMGSSLYWNNAHAALPPTICTGSGTVTCDLWAAQGTIAVPGVGSLPVWGYASAAATPPSLPGPILTVNQGDTVTINLTNGLTEATTLFVQGQQMIPDTTGVAPGASKAYTFVATNPGTYLYEAGLLSNSSHQVAMGMYGALVVQSSTPGQAYANPDSAFDDEALLVFSELDPNLNNSSPPSSFDMRDYHPTYFLINGKSYPQTDPISVGVGSKVLLRLANAGLQIHSISTLGLQQSIVALDGSPSSFPRKLTADSISPGQTSDVIVTMPVIATGSRRYAIFDANFVLSNNSSQGFGGMLTFLKVDSGFAGGDTVGPLTSGVTVTPSKVDGATAINLTASVSDALSGNNNVVAAEYYVNDISGTGTSMGGIFGSPTVSVSATIPAGLPTGDYTIFVRGQDSAGNWGAFSSAALSVDQTGPTIIGLELVPNPSQGSGIVLSASADDRTTGNSDITLAEYQIDGGAWNPMNFVSSASTFYFTTTVSAAGAGIHVTSVRATDALGNVGPASDINLVVDLTGPTTSNVAASPNSTNGLVGVNSAVPAVRVTADFSDAASDVVDAEGFITTTGADGTGFKMLSVDSLFDNLTETGYIDIPLSTFWILPPGPYTVYIHAKDSAGNWGAFSSVVVTRTP